MGRIKRLVMLLVIAGVALAGPGCATTKAPEGAMLGGVIGAATGAVVGHQTGHAGEGAAVGAAVGGLSGGIIGSQLERPASPNELQGAAPVAAPVTGHYETRLVRSATGEYYEERVWVPDY